MSNRFTSLPAGSDYPAWHRFLDLIEETFAKGGATPEEAHSLSSLYFRLHAILGNWNYELGLLGERSRVRREGEPFAVIDNDLKKVIDHANRVIGLLQGLAREISGNAMFPGIVKNY